MHRMFRCVSPFVTTLICSAAFSISSPILAQTTPVAPAAPQAATPAVAPAPASPPFKPHDRLDVRMRLGDGLRTWRPTRRQLGIGYAPGDSDSTPPGQFQFEVDSAAVRKYLTATAPDIHREPVDAFPTVDPSYHGDFDAEQVPA